MTKSGAGNDFRGGGGFDGGGFGGGSSSSIDSELSPLTLSF